MTIFKHLRGKELHKFASELWPLNRSLTGEGVRETLNKISKHLPNLVLKSVPSQTQLVKLSPDFKSPSSS